MAGDTGDASGPAVDRVTCAPALATGFFAAATPADALDDTPCPRGDEALLRPGASASQPSSASTRITNATDFVAAFCTKADGGDAAADGGNAGDAGDSGDGGAYDALVARLAKDDVLVYIAEAATTRVVGNEAWTTFTTYCPGGIPTRYTASFVWIPKSAVLMTESCRSSCTCVGGGCAPVP
jgi:hypothetical protein